MSRAGWQQRITRLATSTFAVSLVIAIAVATSWTWVDAQSPSRVAIDPDDIGGVVTSAKGPEAGVWVVAETTALPTRFARIVATDDQGRYVIPDLPPATYQVFVRGYGLVDSQRQAAKPGQQLNLTATIAPNPRAAAQVYPAAWWLSMADLPSGDLSQREVADRIRGCLNCHQLGGQATRDIPHSVSSVASSTLDAWDRRTKMGPEAPGMGANFQRLGAQRKMFADWTDRIAKGETPKQMPPRPKGVERNIVVTVWDWGTELDGRTDSTPTDVRTPSLNANGPVYAVVQPRDLIAILNPRDNSAATIKVPSNAPKISVNRPPSPIWGNGDIWARSANPRSVAMDARGRLWLTGFNRAPEAQPSFCTSNTFGKYYPLKTGGRQVILFDPKTSQFTHIDTCFSADHNQIGRDNSISFGMNNAVGWIDIDTYDKTKNIELSQGWCPAVLDTNGDGKISQWTDPDAPVDPTKDHRIDFGCYSISKDPRDGSLWCSGIGVANKTLVRIERGSNPPQTCRAEAYEPPPNVTPPIYGSGGLGVDSEGVVWQNWRGSAHFASFDRRKCKVTNGPTATGQSCPEGWTLYRANGPTYQNSASIYADESYLTQIDANDVLGLGKDVPMYGNVNSDSIEVLIPKTKEFVTLRVPYPMGFFSRSAVGRIDNPNTGWKGKGLWSNFSSYAAWHTEGGKGTLPKAVKFQVRPNPLAK